jgi:hypothetical protein
MIVLGIEVISPMRGVERHYTNALNKNTNRPGQRTYE